MSRLSLFPMVAIMLVVAGCAKLESIYRTVDLNEDGKGPSVVVDANQRLVTNIDIVNKSVAGQVVPKRIVCAEPSPDVASAFSKAIEAAVSQSSGTSSASANISASTAQSFGQLGERLATIQLLRDMAYRNCEAYANGSINATSYTILNSRLNKTIVTLLSTEMVAGAFGRKLAAVTASSNAEGSGNSGASGTDQSSPPKSSSAGKTSAKVDSQGAGEIPNAAKPNSEIAGKVAAEIAKIHQNFIQDDSFVTLIDACVAHMNQISVSGAALDRVQDSTTFEALLNNAQKRNEESAFTKICVKDILPAAVKLAQTRRRRE